MRAFCPNNKQAGSQRPTIGVPLLATQMGVPGGVVAGAQDDSAIDGGGVERLCVYDRSVP